MIGLGQLSTPNIVTMPLNTYNNPLPYLYPFKDFDPIYHLNFSQKFRWKINMFSLFKKYAFGAPSVQLHSQ